MEVDEDRGEGGMDMDIRISLASDSSSVLTQNRLMSDYFVRQMIETFVNSGSQQNWEVAKPPHEPSQAYFLLHPFFSPCIFDVDSMFSNGVCDEANFFESSTLIYAGIAITTDGEFLVKPMWLSDLFPYQFAP